MMGTFVWTAILLPAGLAGLVLAWMASTGGGGLDGFARALLLGGLGCLVLAGWGLTELRGLV